MASRVVTSLGYDRARGRLLIDRSLSLNANCAEAWGVSGWNYSCSGNGRLAIEHFQRAFHAPIRWRPELEPPSWTGYERPASPKFSFPAGTATSQAG